MDYDDFEDLIELEEAIQLEEKENRCKNSPIKDNVDSLNQDIKADREENIKINRKRPLSPSLSNNEKKKIVRPDETVKSYLSGVIPFEEEYITFRNDVGKKFYIALHNKAQSQVNFDFEFTTSSSFHEAIDQAITKLANKESFSDLISHESYDENSCLWLNKYQPKNYFDLLSDETTNRLLLRWVKAWDYYVFNRKPKKTKEKPNTENQIYRKFGINENLVEEIDESDKRPRYKLILLHGAPGLGKTTLAHLLAKISGYNIVEMNASDDRSPAIFRSKLEAILNTNTSLQRDKESYKPSCLIIDEIDGAVAASIDLLIEASRTPINTQKKSKNAKLALRRPVICICNDLYAKSLRSFRGQHVPCFILKCTPPSMNRITDRLLEIIDAELASSRIKQMLDKTLLHNLIDICERDVRSCVNALQYICSQSLEKIDTKSIDLDAILRVSGTYKDKNTNLFGIWTQVFTIPSNISNKDNKNLAKRVSDVVESFFSVGEPNLFIAGIFENYLYAKAKDAGLIMASEACTMIEIFDRIHTLINTMQDYSFLKYSSIIPAWFNLSLATYNGIVRMKSFNKEQISDNQKGGSKYTQFNSGIKWPTSEVEEAQKESRVKQTIENCLSNQWVNSKKVSHGDSIRMLSKRAFVLDTAPSLIEMISIKTKRLRSVNSQLYSKSEREDLKEIIDLMLDLGLSWKLQSNSDSESNDIVYQLDPPIESCVLFEGVEESSSLKEINGAVQKLICHEMHLELMRRSEKEAEESLSCNNNNTFDQSRYELVVVKNQDLLEKDQALEKTPKDMYEDIGRIPIISISGYKNVSEYFSDLPLPQSYQTSRKLTDSKAPFDNSVLNDSSISLDLIKALTLTKPTPKFNTCKSLKNQAGTNFHPCPLELRDLYDKDPFAFRKNSTFDFLFNEKPDSKIANPLNGDGSNLNQSVNIDESFEEKDKVYNVVCTQPLKISIKKSQLAPESSGSKVKKKRKSKAEPKISGTISMPDNPIDLPNFQNINNNIMTVDKNCHNFVGDNGDGRIDCEAKTIPESLVNERINVLDTSLNKILSGPIFLPRNNSQNQQNEKENFRSIFDEEPIAEQFSGSTSEHHSTGLIHSDPQSVGILPSLDDPASGKSPASFNSNYSLNTNGVSTPAPSMIIHQPVNNTLPLKNSMSSCYPETSVNTSLPSITTELPLHSVTSTSDAREPSNAPTGLSAYLPPGASQSSKYSPSNSSSSRENSVKRDKDISDDNFSSKSKIRCKDESGNEEEAQEISAKDYPPILSDSSSLNSDANCVTTKTRSGKTKTAAKKGRFKGKNKNEIANKNNSKTRQNAEKKGQKKRRSELEDLMIWQIKDSTNRHDHENNGSFVEDMVERVKIRRQKQQKFVSSSPGGNSGPTKGIGGYNNRKERIYSDDSSHDMTDNSSIQLSSSRKNKSSSSFKGGKNSFPTSLRLSSSSLSSTSDLSQNNPPPVDNKSSKSFKKSLTSSKHSDKNSNYMKKKSETKQIYSSDSEVSLVSSADKVSSVKKRETNCKNNYETNNKKKKTKIYRSSSSSPSSPDIRDQEHSRARTKTDKKRSSTPDTLPCTQSGSDLDIDLLSKSPSKSERKSLEHQHQRKKSLSTIKSKKKKDNKRSHIFSHSSSDLFCSSGKDDENNLPKGGGPGREFRVSSSNQPLVNAKKSKLSNNNKSHANFLSNNSSRNTLSRTSSLESIHDYTNRFSMANAEAEKRRKCKELSATASTLSSFHDLLQEILKRVEDVDLIEISQQLSLSMDVMKQKQQKQEKNMKKHSSDDDEVSQDSEVDHENHKLPDFTHLMPEEVNMLEIQTRQIRVAPGSISSIPTGWLVRFLTLLMLHMRSAAIAPPRFPSSHVIKEVQKLVKKSSCLPDIKNPWISAFWSHPQTSAMLTGISSAVIALNIIDAADIPRSYLMEDLIETIAILAHKVLLNVIFLSPGSVLEFISNSNNNLSSSYTSDNSNSGSTSSTKNTHHLVTYLGKSLTSIMAGMASLIRLQPGKFADNIVFRLTEFALAVPIQFISYPNSPYVKYSVNHPPTNSGMPWQVTLNLASISLIGSIYSQYEGHRKLISEEIFSAILPTHNSISMKNQSDSVMNSKKTAKNYCLTIASHPKYIYVHPMTSLLMSIIQSLISSPSNYSAFHWFSGQQMTVCICHACQISSNSVLNQSRATDKATTTTTMSNSSLCSSIAGKRTNQSSLLPNISYPPTEADLSKITKEEAIIVNSFQQTTLKHASYLLFSLLKKLTLHNQETDAKHLLEVIMSDLFKVMQMASLEWPVSHTLICALSTSLVQLMINLNNNGSREKTSITENVFASRMLCLETLGSLVNHFMELQRLAEDEELSRSCLTNVQLINSLTSACSYLTSPLCELDNNYSETRSKDIYPQLLAMRMEHSDGLFFFARRYHVASLLSEITRNNAEILPLLSSNHETTAAENSILFTFKRQLIGEINSTHHSVSGIFPWYSGKRMVQINHSLQSSMMMSSNLEASPITNASYDSLDTNSQRFLCMNRGNPTSNLFYCIHTGFGLSKTSREKAITKALTGAENLIRLRPFIPSASILYSYICKALSDSSVQIRSKALRIMSSLIEVQPKILLNKNPFQLANSNNKTSKTSAATPTKEVDLNKIIKNRLMDQSICVREATVDLLSRLIILKIKDNEKSFMPILNEYLPLLSNRVLDKGLSVRKRAIKCFREIILHHNEIFIGTNSSIHNKTSSKLYINNEQIFDICAKLIRRLNDEECIKKSVIEIFQCLWFTPSNVMIRELSSNSPSRSQLILHKIQSISNTIVALKTSSSDLIFDLLKNLHESAEVKNGQNYFIDSCQEIIEEILTVLEGYMAQAETGNLRIKFEKKNQIAGFLAILNNIFSLSLSQNMNIITSFSLSGLPVYRYLTRLFHIILVGIERDPQQQTQNQQQQQHYQKTDPPNDSQYRPIIESCNVHAIHNLISATNFAIQQWRLVLLSFLTLQAEQMEILSSTSKKSTTHKLRNSNKNYQFKFELLDTLLLTLTSEKIDRFQEELVRLAQCQGRLVVDSALQTLSSMLSCEVLLKPLEFFFPKAPAQTSCQQQQLGPNLTSCEKDGRRSRLSSTSSSSDGISSANESNSSGMASAERDVINHQVNYVIDRDMITSFASSTRLTICFAQFFTLLVDLANELNNPNDLPVSKIVAREHSLMQRYRPSLMRALYIVGLTGKHVNLETIKQSADRLLDNQGEIISKYFTQERAQHKVKTLRKMVNCLSSPLFDYKMSSMTKSKTYDPLRDQVYIVLMYFIRRALQMDPLVNQATKKRSNCDIDVEVGKKGISGLTLLTHRYHWLILETSIKQVFIDILSRKDFSKDIRVDLQIYVIDALNQYLIEYENQKYLQSQMGNSRLGMTDSMGHHPSSKSISIYPMKEDSSIKQMHDCESAHANTIAQIFHAPIVNNTVCVHSTGLRKSSLNLLASIFKYGLIPPAQSLSSVICLSADPDNQISLKASNLLNQIEARFPGHSVLKSMSGVRSTFQLYKNIHEASKKSQINEKSLNIIVTNDFVRGANFSNTISTEDPNNNNNNSQPEGRKQKDTSAKTSSMSSSSSSSIVKSKVHQPSNHLQGNECAVSVNQFIYSVIKTNRQARRSFLANLVGLFSIDSIATSSQLSIEELIFLSDQLAHLPYSIWDEVLFITHYTEIRASLMASAFVKHLNDCLVNGLQIISQQKGKDKKPEELAKKLVSLVDKADDELLSIMKKRHDKKNKSESVSWDYWPDFDETDANASSEQRPHEQNLSTILMASLQSQNVCNFLNTWTTQSAIAILLIFVKSFLKAAYNITDLKQRTYSPTDSAKQWDKSITLNASEKYSNYLSSNGLIYLPKAISICQHLAKCSTNPKFTSLTLNELRCLTRLWLVVKHLHLKTSTPSLEEETGSTTVGGNSNPAVKNETSPCPNDIIPSGDYSSQDVIKSDFPKKEIKYETNNAICESRLTPLTVVEKKSSGKKRSRELRQYSEDEGPKISNHHHHQSLKSSVEKRPRNSHVSCEKASRKTEKSAKHSKSWKKKKRRGSSSSSELTSTTAESSAREDLSSLSSD